MDNELRIYNGNKQVKKGKVWRPCCTYEGCTNRTENKLCYLHDEKVPRKINTSRNSIEWKEKLIKKSKKDESKIICIISKHDNSENDINTYTRITRDDKCKFLCYCGEETIRNIRCILKHNMYCKIHSNEIKQTKRIQTTQKKYGENITCVSQLEEVKNKMKKTTEMKYGEGINHYSQLQICKEQVQKTRIKNKEIKINNEKNKLIKDFESTLITDYYSSIVSFILKSKGDIKKYKLIKISQLYLLINGFYKYLDNLEYKFNYDECIKFLKPFKITSQQNYLKYFRNYKNLPIYLSLSKREYPEFSWNTYISKVFVSYEKISQYAKNIVYPWGLENNLGHNLGELWEAYINENGIPINFPKEPRKYYKEWKENDSWSGFFGKPKKIIKRRVKGKPRTLLSKEDKEKLINDKTEKYNSVKIQQNQDDLLFPGIYLYIFPDGKKYVGQTKTTILYRCGGHINEAFNNRQRGCTILDNKTRDVVKLSCNGDIPIDKIEWEKIFYKKVKIMVLEVIEQNDLTEIEYFNLLNERETYYIKEYKCYHNSKDYDGSLGLNCKPGEIGTEMHKRGKNNCYDHNGKSLYCGVESIKIRKRIVGYKSRIRGKFENTITLGNSYKGTLDEKLKICIEFAKLKITSIEKEKQIVSDFKKKYNIIERENNGTTKSSKKIDHNGKELPANIFYDKEKKEYNVSIIREGVSKRFCLRDLDNLDEQLKYAEYFLTEIIKISLEDTTIINMNYTDIKKYLKENDIPIMTLNKNRKRVCLPIMLIKLLKYQNYETKQEIIDEYNSFKEWHDTPGFPEGWKQMWGDYNVKRKGNGWNNVGHFTFKNPENIIFSHEKVAKKNIDTLLPDFNKIVDELPEEISHNEFKTCFNKYKWPSTKGWEPYISDTWKKYVEKHSDQGKQKYKGIRFDKESNKWRGSFKYNGKTYETKSKYSQDKAKEELDRKMIEIIGYIMIDDKKKHIYIDKTDTNKYKFRKNNKSKTFNTLIEALCYKYIILLKIKSNITT